MDDVIKVIQDLESQKPQNVKHSFDPQSNKDLVKISPLFFELYVTFFQ